MFLYEELIWSLMFPFLCCVMMWFSIDLALLVRAGGGRRRRQNAVRAVEQLVLQSPTVDYVHNAEDHHRRHPSSNPTSRLEHQYVSRTVDIPAAMRIATRAVTRRAVVVVGGDFARSPRMQYHAASLAKSGLFDEVVLVGLDYGNQLSESLLSSGIAKPETFVTTEIPAEVEAAVRRRLQRRPQEGSGCIVSMRYLAKPPIPPDWFEVVFPLRGLHWLACTIYRVVVFTLLFSWQITRATAIRVNAHGQLLLTDVIFVQTPPAVPFVLLVKYLVRPVSWLYSCFAYYCFIVPASWMNRGALEDIRAQCCHRSQHLDVHNKREWNGSPPPTPLRASPQAHHPWSRNRLSVFWPSLVVDWHNFGYTVLQAARRPRAVVEMYKFLELHGCAGDVNITVSEAMQRMVLSDVLHRRPSSPLHSLSNRRTCTTMPTNTDSEADVVVLYDVAPSLFAPVEFPTFVDCVVTPTNNDLMAIAPSPTPLRQCAARHATTADIAPRKVEGTAPQTRWGIAPPPPWVLAAVAERHSCASQTNSFRASAGSVPSKRRGLMVVGSTSWTEEDDYSILVEALQRLDHRLCHEYKYLEHNNNSITATPLHGSSASAGPPPVSSPPDLLDLWVLITGKGSTRRQFESSIRAANLSSHIVVSTVYLQSYQQYSMTLGAADVGLCLHFSTSGLDLPMKGVDMLGCGLPVMALDYPAIGELMGRRASPKHNVSGCTTPVKSAPSHASTDTSSESSGIVACEKGWLFTTARELEALLASFVGLQSATGCSNGYEMHSRAGVMVPSYNGPATSTRTAVASATAAGGLTALEEAQLRVRSAPRIDWDTNWRAVMMPLLQKAL